MAAAPELLVKLKELMGWLDRLDMLDLLEGLGEDFQQLRDEAKAAIRAAEEERVF